jgi:hypothetical protein
MFEFPSFLPSPEANTTIIAIIDFFCLLMLKRLRLIEWNVYFVDTKSK